MYSGRSRPVARISYHDVGFRLRILTAMSSTALPEMRDLQETIRLQQQRYAERMRERNRVPIQIQGAYRNSWSNYYAWEPQHCDSLLRGLRAPSVNTYSTFDDLLAEVCSPASDTDNQQPHPTGIDPALNLTQWLANGDTATTVTAAVIRLPSLSLGLFAYPKYEACAPAISLIRHDLDQNILQFIPYADEIGFKEYRKSMARSRTALQWQIGWYDVDCMYIYIRGLELLQQLIAATDKLIALDAVWSLHNVGIPLSTIEENSQRIPYFPTIFGRSGLISDMHHRYVCTRAVDRLPFS